MLQFDDTPKYTFIPQPIQPVGYWQLDNGDSPAGSFRIAMRMKPTDEQIKNTEQMFGWKWIDA